MKYRFYFVRHGETVFNVEGRVQGWNDSALTDLGVMQAKCLGYGLKEISFDGVYSGDLKRQMDTAKIILSQGNNPDQEIQTDARLREMNYGHYQGGPYVNMLKPVFDSIGVPFGDWDEARKRINAVDVSRFLAAHNEDIEPVESVQKRIVEKLKEIMSEHEQGGTFMVSTSSVAIDDLVEYVLPNQNRKGLVHNCSVCVIESDGNQFRLVDYDDISFRICGEEHFSSMNR